MLLQGELRNAAVNFDTYPILQIVDNGTYVYAKQSKLVDADESGAKAMRLKVIQGHVFFDHWKADEGLRIIV